MKQVGIALFRVDGYKPGTHEDRQFAGLTAPAQRGRAKMKARTVLCAIAVALGYGFSPCFAQVDAPRPFGEAEGDINQFISISTPPVVPLAKPANNTGFYVSGELGLYSMWTHGGSPFSAPSGGGHAGGLASPGPLFGPSLSLGVFNESGAGIRANWWEATESSTSGMRSVPRKP